MKKIKASMALDWTIGSLIFILTLAFIVFNIIQTKDLAKLNVSEDKEPVTTYMLKEYLSECENIYIISRNPYQVEGYEESTKQLFFLKYKNTTYRPSEKIILLNTSDIIYNNHYINNTYHNVKLNETLVINNYLQDIYQINISSLNNIEYHKYLKITSNNNEIFVLPQSPQIVVLGDFEIEIPDTYTQIITDDKIIPYSCENKSYNTYMLCYYNTTLQNICIESKAKITQICINNKIKVSINNIENNITAIYHNTNPLCISKKILIIKGVSEW